MPLNVDYIDQKSMAPPWLALGAFLVAKKAIAASIYAAGSRYGWPRVFRRLVEFNKRVTPAGSQRAVQSAIKQGFRLPLAAVQLLRDPSVQLFLASAAEAPAAKAFVIAPGVSLSTLLRIIAVLPERVVGDLAQSVAKSGGTGRSSPPGTGATSAPSSATSPGRGARSTDLR